MNVLDLLSNLRARWRLSPLLAIALTALALCDLAGVFALWRAFHATESDLPAVRIDLRLPDLARNDGAPVWKAGSQAQTLERPIFSPTRRPSRSGQITADGAENDAPPPQGMRLVGLIGFDRQWRAYVVSDATQDGKWCNVGDLFEGWTVADIQSSAVILKNGARSIKLALYPRLPMAPASESDDKPNGGSAH